MKTNDNLQQLFDKYLTKDEQANNRLVCAFEYLMAVTLPSPKPIADEAYDKKCLKAVNFYEQMCLTLIGNLELTADDAEDAGLQYASCARVHDAVMACMKTLRNEIDVWLESCEDDKTPVLCDDDEMDTPF